MTARSGFLRCQKPSCRSALPKWDYREIKRRPVSYLRMVCGGGMDSNGSRRSHPMADIGGPAPPGFLSDGCYSGIMPTSRFSVPWQAYCADFCFRSASGRASWPIKNSLETYSGDRRDHPERCRLRFASPGHRVEDLGCVALTCPMFGTLARWAVVGWREGPDARAPLVSPTVDLVSLCVGF